MKKSSALKRAVVINLVALAASLAMLVSVSFAWFTLTRESDRTQSITVGSFTVQLNDTAATAGTLNVALADTFPMTEAYAAANAAELRNTYLFEVKNAGTIAAMYRFRVTVTEESAKPIAPQLRYRLRHYTDPAAKTDAGTGYVTDPAGNDANVSLEEALETVTVKAEQRTENGTDSTVHIGTAEGTLIGGALRWFEILIWLDENATVDSTGAGDAAAARQVTLSLTMQAIQSAGGATWENFAP